MSELMPIELARAVPLPFLACHAASVLEEISREVEQLGARLCSSAEVVANHLETLQGIDLIAQQLAGLAQLLASECPATAVEQLRLESLRDRFARIDAEIHRHTAPAEQIATEFWPGPEPEQGND